LSHEVITNFKNKISIENFDLNQYTKLQSLKLRCHIPFKAATIFIYISKSALLGRWTAILSAFSSNNTPKLLKRHILICDVATLQLVFLRRTSLTWTTLFSPFLLKRLKSTFSHQKIASFSEHIFKGKKCADFGRIN